MRSVETVLRMQEAAERTPRKIETFWDVTSCRLVPPSAGSCSARSSDTAWLPRRVETSFAQLGQPNCCRQQLYINIEATPTMFVHLLKNVAYKVQVFQTPSDQDRFS